MLKPNVVFGRCRPWDPELITLKAIRTIAAANVILYDALVNQELLNYASPNAIKKFVGSDMDASSFRSRK